MKSSKDAVKSMLLQLGLSEHEAVTYTALLELEAVSVRKVAEYSGVNRGTTYDAIKQLVSKGLVRTRKSGQREYFSAESPEKIYDIIRDKRKDLLQVQKDAQQLVPEMSASKSRPYGRPVVKYYENDEGIVALLRDVLQTCRTLENPEYYVYSSRPLRQYMYRKFPKFTERRITEGITVKVIAIGEGGDPAELSERRWLAEPDEVTIASYTIIYGNKTAQISISNDYTPYAVVTDNRGATAMQRLLFEKLWTTL
jgi:sugar-specific transcriptional regulator TrmB